MERDNTTKNQGYSKRLYLKVLEEQLPRCWKPSMLFQQDNASIHTTKEVIQWLENEGISLFEWPPISPDLNPIEKIWAILKQRIIEKYPHLLDLGKSQEALDALAKAIVDEWNAIPQEIIDRTIRSVDYAINVVIVANGWYTPH